MREDIISSLYLLYANSLALSFAPFAIMFMFMFRQPLYVMDFYTIQDQEMLFYFYYASFMIPTQVRARKEFVAGAWRAGAAAGYCVASARFSTLWFPGELSVPSYACFAPFLPCDVSRGAGADRRVLGEPYGNGSPWLEPVRVPTGLLRQVTSREREEGID